MHDESPSGAIELVCDKIGTLIGCGGVTRLLDTEIGETPRVRGIESKEDWQEYIETVERNGNILEKLCDELNVDALHLVATVKSLKKSKVKRQSSSGIKEAHRGTAEMDLSGTGNCIDWTDFICNTKCIAEQVAIENQHAHLFYNEALQKVREAIEEQSLRDRPEKIGPVLYAAFEGASPTERDWIRGGIVTKAVLNFRRPVEALEE
nr:unnamed protein product [Haemonchus contortus]